MGITALPAERHQKLLQMAKREEVIRVSEAAALLDVHEITIRRDLDVLAEQGLLERVHGGARFPQREGVEVRYHLRLQENREVKERLAQEAVKLVEDGDSVAIDASTTCLALARLLPVDTITAIATNLEAANVLAESGQPFIMAGGMYYPRSHSFVGSLVAAMLARLNPDKVFFSAKGFTPETGFADALLPEADIKERLIASAAMVVAILDHSKFGVRALNTFATPRNVHVLITDQPLEPHLHELFGTAGTRVVVASPQ